MTSAANPDISQQRVENRDLAHVLTALMAAVSQQFFHILLLRRHGEAELVTRFVAVDDEDFKNAMQIMDLLTRRGVLHLPARHTLSPGHTVPQILQSELHMEVHLKETLEKLAVQSEPAQRMLARAANLRPAYRQWLQAELAKRGPAEPRKPNDGDLVRLVEHLLRLMEQTLVHAFEHWSAGDIAQADTAWQMSGAAMLYLTALAPYVGGRGPEKLVVAHPARDGSVDRFTQDVTLIRQCADLAAKITGTSETSRQNALCQKIAADCLNLSQTQRGQAITATMGYSRIFEKFDNARRRMME